MGAGDQAVGPGVGGMNEEEDDNDGFNMMDNQSER